MLNLVKVYLQLWMFIMVKGIELTYICKHLIWWKLLNLFTTVNFKYIWTLKNVVYANNSRIMRVLTGCSRWWCLALPHHWTTNLPLKKERKNLNFGRSIKQGNTMNIFYKRKNRNGVKGNWQFEQNVNKNEGEMSS